MPGALAVKPSPDASGLVEDKRFGKFLGAEDTLDHFIVRIKEHPKVRSLGKIVGHVVPLLIDSNGQQGDSSNLTQPAIQFGDQSASSPEEKQR